MPLVNRNDFRTDGVADFTVRYGGKTAKIQLEGLAADSDTPPLTMSWVEMHLRTKVLEKSMPGAKKANVTRES